MMLAVGWAYQGVGLPADMRLRQMLGLGLIYGTLLGAQAFLIVAVVEARRKGQDDDRTLGKILAMAFAAVLLAWTVLFMVSAVCGYPLAGLTARTWPADTFQDRELWKHWLWQGFLALLFFGTQLAFLLGAPKLGVPEQRHERPVWLSLLGGTLVLAVLGCGLYWVTTEIRNLVLDHHSKEGAVDFDPTSWAVVAVGWVFWLVVFGLLWRGPWSQTLRRLYRTILAGTALELLVTLPVDVHVRKRQNCYCTTGTYCALTIGLFAALWCFGPGLVFLLLTRARQRRRLPGHCRACGLDVRQSPGSSCPDCGAAIRRQATVS
jgi:hypothetical protein